VADSHVAETLPEMPPEVFRALAGVDLVLHAGDLTDLAVLARLGSLAPAVAVRGNHDRQGGIDLPVTRRLRIAGARVGLVHGDRSKPFELVDAVRSLVAGRPRVGGVVRHLARVMADCDLVVFGHLHIPILARRGRTLLFSPGAVYVPEADPYGDDTAIRSRLHHALRAALPEAARRPSVGLVEIERGRIRPYVIPLREPIRPPVPGAGATTRGRVASPP
jgi:putative phosphoesterase